MVAHARNAPGKNVRLVWHQPAAPRTEGACGRGFSRDGLKASPLKRLPQVSGRRVGRAAIRFSPPPEMVG
ncbi:hypothetical protein MDS_4159 [Ectopseudomonas mendocina NK-01]|nr:hypothetical protein MDS_4159 [Pseudomonas mendocina NK-01]